MKLHSSRIRLLVLPALLVSAMSTAQTYSRTEVISYHDNVNKWVLGQVASVTCTASVPASTACDGDVASSTTFDSTYALPLASQQFGRTVQTLAWNTTATVASGQRGTVASVKDGKNNTITLSSWKRGIPQSVQYPATPESPAGALQSATVSDAGWITAATEENGYKTCYAYDVMGRISQITYPSESVAGVCDASTWSATTRAFVQVASPEHGIPAGHWRQTVATGNGLKVSYFDGLWRPLIVHEYDAANPATTARYQRFEYALDPHGIVTFESYPAATLAAATTGRWQSIDPLGRIRGQTETSELGLLATQYHYLSGFQTRVTDPRGNQTTISYLAWDEPSFDLPLSMVQPEGAYSDISRDAFGKLTAITRRNAGGSVSVARRYVYDGYQQLCKSIEPETASTVLEYDGAGNVIWSASGQALPSTTACDRASVATGQKAIRSWDGRNRLSALSFSDSNGSQIWSYTADGLPAQVTTQNDGGASTVTNAYTYNRRRLLTGESQNQTGGQLWSFGYTYNANGHMATLTYPAGLSVAYAPNALGQPTQAGTFATGVQYHPNGAIKGFTYGNGMVHGVLQNVRGLPEWRADCTVAVGCDLYERVVHLRYDYDRNGNVVGITDNSLSGRQTRTMAYDGLDRLTQATSPMFGTASYGYDVLDNLTSVNVTGGSLARNQLYCYASNRLATLRTGSCSGTILQSLGYDARGNLASKGAQTFGFDYGNRLRTALGAENYRYDDQGRRTRTSTAGGLLYEMYSQDGKLLWQRDEVIGARFQYVYLNDRVVAVRKRPIGAETEEVIYWHTDVIGSQIAASVAATVVQTTEHEPYGRMVNRTNNNRMGYAGHVMDAGTGLIQMQQRYYDPVLGIFLSVDPITAYGNPISQFHRYRYGNNNPYKFTDPDGRQVVCDENRCSGTVRNRLDELYVLTVYVSRVVENAIVNTITQPGIQIPEETIRGLTQTNQSEGDGPKTLAPGEHAGDSIPARGPGRDFTPGERERINEIGGETGCHTCGSTDPGTKSGNFVPDHQPPSATNTTGQPQRLYPQCLSCSRTQGGEVRQHKPPPPPEEKKTR